MSSVIRSDNGNAVRIRSGGFSTMRKAFLRIPLEMFRTARDPNEQLFRFHLFKIRLLYSGRNSRAKASVSYVSRC